MICLHAYNTIIYTDNDVTKITMHERKHQFL